jgi:nucleoside 2-deoxyribosyltransferase
MSQKAKPFFLPKNSSNLDENKNSCARAGVISLC